MILPFALIAALFLGGCAAGSDTRQDVRGVGTGRDEYPPSHCAGCPTIKQPNTAAIEDTTSHG